MAASLHIGCCGWSYLRPAEFSNELSPGYKSTLEAYAQLLGCVEINSTFYRIPRVATAEKWLLESTRVSPGFEFAVKAYQGITHMDRFGRRSAEYFDAISGIARTLKARVILFQSPASFQPTSANMRKLTGFFDQIDRGGTTLAWEPRGKWLESPHELVEILTDCNLVHCVDPLRNRPLSFGRDRVGYFRLHGFGRPSIYNYDYARRELEEIKSIVDSLWSVLRSVYVFFNNTACYANARTFVNMTNR